MAIMTMNAEPYLMDVNFDVPEIGDIVALDHHKNPEWQKGDRVTVSGTEDGAIQAEGVWYRSADGWSVRRLVTPQTVTRREPYGANWDLGARGYFSNQESIIRELSDAESLITVKDFEQYMWQNRERKLKILAKHMSWETFARIGKIIDINQADKLLEPFATESTEPFSFVPYRYLTGNDVNNAIYWLLSLAFHAEGAPNHKDVVTVVDTLGFDLFFDFVARETPLSVMLSIAGDVKDNDIDTQLLSSLNASPFGADVKWM